MTGGKSRRERISHFLLPSGQNEKAGDGLDGRGDFGRSATALDAKRPRKYTNADSELLTGRARRRP